MIDRIIEACAKHKFLVFLFIAVGVLFGEDPFDAR